MGASAVSAVRLRCKERESEKVCVRERESGGKEGGGGGTSAEPAEPSMGLSPAGGASCGERLVYQTANTTTSRQRGKPDNT